MSSISEIAEQLGISKSTVSRALRGVPGIAPGTVEAVRARADELGYIPSVAAAGLSTGRNYAVGVVVPALNRWFYELVLSGINRVLASHGYDLVLFDLDRGHGKASRLFARSILRHRVDAVLVVSTVFSTEEIEEFGLLKVPVLAVGAPSPGMRRIGVDDDEIMTAATRHIIDLGHRHIGLLGGYDPESLSVLGAAEREQAFMRTVTEAGAVLHPAWMLSGSYRMGVARQVTEQLFRSDSYPSALVCASDEMAIGAIYGLQAAGLRLAQDVSVIGIDGHEYGAAFGLTTCAQDPEAQGEYAARQIISEIEGGEAVGDFVPSPFELVIRESTAPPSPKTRRR